MSIAVKLAAMFGQARTTWNPSDKAAVIALSNSDLDAAMASTSGLSGVRAIGGKSVGKYYYETETIAGLNNIGQCIWGGLCTASQSLTPSTPGQTAHGIGVETTDGNVFQSSADTAVKIYSSVVDGDIIGCAVDLGGKLYWARKNGGNWNGSALANPATGVGGIAIVDSGPYYPYAVLNVDTPHVRANFGATAFAYTAPSGFGAWE